jgi:hypothetical protein
MRTYSNTIKTSDTSYKFRENYGFIIVLILGIILCFLSIRCDCWTDGNGVVIDSITNQPLDSVVAKSYIEKVTEEYYHMEMITDSTGKFNGTTGNTGKCADIVIVLSKKGYTTTTVTNPKNDTIKMIK